MKKLFILAMCLPMYVSAQKHEINIFLLDNDGSKYKSSYVKPVDGKSRSYEENVGMLRYAAGYNYISKHDVEFGVAFGMGKNKSSVKDNQNDVSFTNMETTYNLTQRWLYVAPSLGRRFYWNKMILHASVSVPISNITYSDYTQTYAESMPSSPSSSRNSDATFTYPSSLTYGFSANTLLSYPLMKHLFISGGVGLNKSWFREKGRISITEVYSSSGSTTTTKTELDVESKRSTFTLNPYLGLRLIF